uniref:aspartic proteinase CDR1-like n=1 Tax=Erigeron canadensis TaxID=72917 RepID=UPI001CB944FE|nr:aspartic proteinase CDR1-like [Erigeron canadensis]
MAFSSTLFAITLVILYICSLTTSSIVTSDGTFSINLIHRDSIKSPFFDRSMTYSQRIGNTLQRSFINSKRAMNANPGPNNFQTDIIPAHGEFLMNISIGNPPHEVMAIADSGSDLTWIQCEPCIKCYQQKAKLFNPKNSSTYKSIPCESKICLVVSQLEKRCSRTKECRYSTSYSDGTVSDGIVASESVTIGDKVVPNIIFGCGFHNDGSFRDTWGGVVGLGGGDASLVSQLMALVPGKFSYCLIPFPEPDDLSEKSSKLTFGIQEFGPSFVSTPLVLLTPKTYYRVTFEGVSVNGQRFNVGNESNPSPIGNMIVDSGTTLTMLPTKVYNEVEAAIRNAVNLRTMKDPQKVLKLCYRATKVTKIPKVVMHFDGADVEFTRQNIFVTVSKHIMCLAMAPTDDLAVYGNLAQQNFMVGYDLEKNTMSFKQTDCEKL